MLHPEPTAAGPRPEPARVVGPVRRRGGHREYVMCRHTPDLRLPHDRVRVTSLHQLPTHDGVAYTAELALDGQFVGTIENDGNGGATTYHAVNSSAFNWRHLREFVHGSRRAGQSVCEETVLEALVTEYDTDCLIDAANAVGRTVLREMAFIVDGDDRPIGEALPVAQTCSATVPPGHSRPRTPRPKARPGCPRR